MRKSINGPYYFEQEISIDLLRLNKNNMINGLNGLKNDTKWYETINEIIKKHKKAYFYRFVLFLSFLFNMNQYRFF